MKLGYGPATSARGVDWNKIALKVKVSSYVRRMVLVFPSLIISSYFTTCNWTVKRVSPEETEDPAKDDKAPTFHKV